MMENDNENFHSTSERHRIHIYRGSTPAASLTYSSQAGDGRIDGEKKAEIVEDI